MSIETIPQSNQPDIAKSAELYRGDINDAVIKAQQITGPEIDKKWWDNQVGNNGSPEDILERFDKAYEQKVESIQPKPEASQIPQNNEEINESMEIEAQKEEKSWDENYIPIGSPEYNEANQKRIDDGQTDYTVKDENGNLLIGLFASLRRDPETGEVISGHDYSPKAESHRVLEQQLADYITNVPKNEQLIIFEGDPRIIEDRDQAIIEATDSGLVQHLADKDKIPTVSGEPTEAETIEIMEKLGVSHEEVLAFYVARGLEGQMAGEGADFLAGYINHLAASLGIEGFRDYTDTEKEAIVAEGRLDEVKAELARKAETLLPSLNELYQPALDNKDLFIADGDNIILNPEFNLEEIGQISMDKLSWDGDNRINEIAKINMEMRDRFLVHRIIESRRDGKKPFVAYGSAHILSILPVLENYFVSKPEL